MLCVGVKPLTDHETEFEENFTVKIKYKEISGMNPFCIIMWAWIIPGQTSKCYQDTW